MDVFYTPEHPSNYAIRACAQRLLAIGAPPALSVAIVGPVAATRHGFSVLENESHRLV